MNSEQKSEALKIQVLSAKQIQDAYIKSLNAIETPFYTIWETPNYKRQVSLIDSILAETPEPLQCLLFHHTAVNFKKIPTDLRDKFFYLLKKTMNHISFDYLLSIEDTDVCFFIWSQISSKSMFPDWDDRRFLEYLVRCKPYLLDAMKIKAIDEKLIREFIDAPMCIKNREHLYNMLKDKQ